MDKQTVLDLAAKAGIAPEMILEPEMQPVSGGKIEGKLSGDLNELGQKLAVFAELVAKAERDFWMPLAKAAADEAATWYYDDHGQPREHLPAVMAVDDAIRSREG